MAPKRKNADSINGAAAQGLSATRQALHALKSDRSRACLNAVWRDCLGDMNEIFITVSFDWYEQYSIFYSWDSANLLRVTVMQFFSPISAHTLSGCS